MKSLLQKILSAIIPLFIIAGIAHASALTSSVPSTFETYLANQQGSGDVTMTLANGVLGDGSALTGFQCFTVDGNTPSQEYECGTASGTSITNIFRGLDSISGTTTISSLQLSHRRGADVKVSDYPILTIIDRELNGSDWIPNILSYGTTTATTTIASSTYNIPNVGYVLSQIGTATSSLLVSNNSWSGTNSYSSTSTFTGSTTFNSSLPTSTVTPTVSTQLTTKAYVDAQVIAGGVTATNAATGISRIASSTQIASGYASTTAYSIPSSLASSTASTTNNIVVVSNSTGTIDPSFINTASLANASLSNVGTSTNVGAYPIYGQFGNQASGNVTIAANSTTTLTANTFYNNLTVNGVLVTGNYLIFVAGTATGTGIIEQNGNAGGTGGSNASGSSGGTGGTSISGYVITSAGGGGGATATNNENAGTNGSATTSAIGNSGSGGGSGGGGAGASGGSAGSISSTTVPIGTWSFSTFSLTDFPNNSGSQRMGMNSGSGGGGGGGASGGIAGGGGGGAGSSGGFVGLFANVWGGSFTIETLGGAGGAGGANQGGGTGGGGGGGGGSGGTALVVYGSKTWTGSFILTGGTGGAAGAGNSPSAGSNGLTGVSYQFPLNSLLR